MKPTIQQKEKQFKIIQTIIFTLLVFMFGGMLLLQTIL
jgi:hypothetical protein